LYEEAIINADFVAVPGCYPTGTLLALKPLAEAGFIDSSTRPVINATSGVSGAGKKPSMSSSYFEVSLQAYGVLSHRHTPEIENYCGTPVIFTPHLGPFKRGILATITMRLKSNVTESDIQQCFENCYAEQAMIRLRSSWPKIDEVANTAYCDIHWKFDPSSGYIVISSAIDNLLKGAASQAVQCANLAFKLPTETGLI
jgi:N-acetyl-gamma-glutamyl-phosphate reductase